MSTLSGLGAAVRRETAGYAPEEDRPLAGYAGALAGYLLTFGGVGALARRRLRRQARPLPDVTPWDVVLLGVASHKLSRMTAKSPVTSPLRAPFARYTGVSGEAELAEEVRGHGARKVLGELLTCPFCLGQWTASGFVAGLVFAPRATRLVAATFAAHAVSDLLQFGYAATQESVTGDG